MKVQGKEFRSLGIEGEWDNPYLTMAFESEAMIVSEFLDMAMKGGLVRGAKPIMWSPVERTALAEAEGERILAEAVQRFDPGKRFSARVGDALAP